MKKKKSNKKKQDDTNLSGFWAGLMLFTGLLLGSLIGAGVMLLLAPQSGKKTRKQLRRKGRDLREQATDAVDETAAQIRTKAHQVSDSLHEQVEEMQQRGHAVIDEGKERFATVVEAGKTAVNGS
jgi:gas vesicle protein